MQKVEGVSCLSYIPPWRRRRGGTRTRSTEIPFPLRVAATRRKPRYDRLPVLLYSCTPVLLYSCTPVLLYSCTPVLLYSCAPVLLCSCTPVLLYSWANDDHVNASAHLSFASETTMKDNDFDWKSVAREKFYSLEPSEVKLCENIISGQRAVYRVDSSNPEAKRLNSPKSAAQ
jgi:hypothetical protein